MIRRAVPTDASALTAVAHAAKRHWRYPEEWTLSLQDTRATPATGSRTCRSRTPSA